MQPAHTPQTFVAWSQCQLKLPGKWSHLSLSIQSSTMQKVDLVLHFCCWQHHILLIMRSMPVPLIFETCSPSLNGVVLIREEK
jgi:hypothetical protein